MSQKSGFQKVLDAMTHQLPKAVGGKDFYPAIIVGANIGGLFSKHLAKATHGNKEQFISYTNAVNPQDPMRSIYEQQRVSKTDYLMSSGLAVEQSAATSDMLGVKQYLPEENAVILEDGKRVGYNQLIIAQGLKEDLSLIKGLEEAFVNFDVPVFTTGDHPTWNVFNYKFTKWLGNYNHGDAYFYIPKFPFRNEINAYHFFNAQTTWEYYKKIGKLSPTATFTIINANDSFTQFEDDVDEFFKTECEKRGINVIYNTEMNEVNSENMTITTTDASGNVNVRDFNNLYVIPPCSPHQNLVDAGLVNKDGFKMDVNLQTLQNTTYENVWGIGDVANLPVTSSFWGGFSQAIVTSHNVYSALKGLPAEIPYDGYTKSIVHLGPMNLTWTINDYNGPRSGHMLDSSGSVISRLRYLHWGKAKKKSFMAYYSGKKIPLHATVLGYKKKFNQLPKVEQSKTTTEEYTPTN